MRIRKDDQVVVLSGKDRGKKGRVMRIYPTESMVLVEKVNYMKKAVRKSQSNPQGGVTQMESKIHVSKVKLVCPRCGKPARIGYTFLADGKKQRSCKTCRDILGE